MTQKIEVHSGDEMELIADNINELLAYIRGIMVNVSDNSKKLNSSSKQIFESHGMAGDNVSDVSATMEQMSASMQEISSTLSEVNYSVEKEYSLVEDMASRAKKGSESSKMVMKKAENIHSKAIEDQRIAKDRTNFFSRGIITNGKFP